MMKMKILVINENMILSKLISDTLVTADHEVICTSNGIEAYTLINESKPDLVILDLLLSYVTAYELIKFIQSTASVKPIKIMVLTKVIQDKVIEATFQLGIDDYMFLPLRKAELLARVDRVSRYANVG